MAGWTVTYGSGTGQSAAVVGPGAAPYTYGGLNTVYQGAYACQLDSGTGPLNHDSFASISQSDLITPTNTILEFYYAAVLDGAHASVPSDDAYMTVEVLFGAVPIIQNLYAYAQSPSPLVDDGWPQKRHLPWTLIHVDLSAYVGLTVTVRFTAYDCAYGGHDSLAYVDGFDFVAPSATPSVTPTDTPTLTCTPTPSVTPTFTHTATRSVTYTMTPTFSFSPTVTPSFTITQTFTDSPTFSHTPTATPTPTPTSTRTPTPTPSMTPTFSPTRTDSPTATATPTHSPTRTDSPTATATPSFTPSATWTATPTDSPTPTQTPTFSHSPTITQTFTYSPTFTITPTFSITKTPVSQSGLLELRGIYPNPFSDQCALFCTLTEDAELRLTVYNVAGEVVDTIVQPGLMGTDLLVWKGENSYGGRVASGVYLLRLQAMTSYGQSKVIWDQAAVTR